jgi:hypothetical protein
MHLIFWQIILNYLVTYVQPSLQIISGIELLREFDRRWQNHQIMNRYLQNIFRYLVSAPSYLHL